jgi:hypothetical protein
MALHPTNLKTLFWLMVAAALLVLGFAVLRSGVGSNTQTQQAYLASGDSLTRVTASGFSETADCRADEGWTIFDGSFQYFPRSLFPCTDTGFLSFKQSLKQKIIDKLGQAFYDALVP